MYGYNAFRTRTVLSASVLQDSKETVLSVKTSTSAKRGKPVSARNVNTWGSYECSCSGFTSEISVGGRLAYNVIIGTCSRCVLKHCHVSLVSQQYMDSEIRAIMAQYMPLDSQPEVPNHVNDERA
ncbi:hypothetical protein Bca52824_048587 [Brassica carinata]|uniref:Uncharacterized protein n=1 Tax=Brassica carinata TaxID=52824 RepID=A0A8X7RGT6_BRACI|nr:hypothetical protein Bca52824_048587 [Brassica carinata]